MKSYSKTNWWLLIHAAVFYLFLYIPLLCVVVFSFNEGRSTTVWVKFSFAWYERLLSDRSLHTALTNSLIVTSASTAIATVLGTVVAYVLHRYSFRGNSVIGLLIQLPIFLPDIVLGIATLSMLVLIDFPLGLPSLILAHVTFCTALVAIVVRARLAGFPLILELAARDLGANSYQIFRRVTLPLMAPGVLAGALLSFALSFDDFTISFFVAGVGSTTLPLRIFSMLHFGVTPVVNALSTLLVLTSFSLVFLASRFTKDALIR